MRILCWIPKAINTHPAYVSFIAVPLHWLHERISMLRYTYIACLVMQVPFRKSAFSILMAEVAFSKIKWHSFHKLRFCDLQAEMTGW
jgi:hypothetical protein